MSSWVNRRRFLRMARYASALALFSSVGFLLTNSQGESHNAGAIGPYLPVYLEGDSGGSGLLTEDTLVVSLVRPATVFALAHPSTLSGHFSVEVEFDSDQAVGLALIKETHGRPDSQNFTSIIVDQDSTGNVFVQVVDRQYGNVNIRDNTGRLPDSADRYTTILDGSRFSAPFIGTKGKVRIFRDGPAGFFHFYYYVGKTVTEEAANDWTRSQEASGWLELAPSRDWSPPDTRFYAAPYVRTLSIDEASVQFRHLRTTVLPTQDQMDRQTGFAVTERPYHWSGYNGNAFVVTFGTFFPYQNNGYKYVFWTQANYEPVWHFTNNLLYGYEHLETWDQSNDPVTGCYEPMSDRFLRWSKVEVIEDNAVRKVLKWSYVLCNPNYQTPAQESGTQLPMGIEYYTFYPDGTGTRRMLYYPKLDSGENNWHELAELMIIKGTQEEKNPQDYIADPVFTAANLEGVQTDFAQSWYGSSGYADDFASKYRDAIQGWNQMILVSHLKDMPDPFIVFSNASDTPGTGPSYPATTDISWHNTFYQFAHWPVGCEPYISRDGFKTMGTWPQQVAATSVAGVEMWSDTNQSVHEWLDHTQTDTEIDPSGPRRFREWVTLIGLTDQGDLATVRAHTSTWLYPGSIRMNNTNGSFTKIDYSQKALIFHYSQGDLSFTLDPTERSATILHPAFQVNNWGNNPVSVQLNGTHLTQGKDYLSAFQGNALLLWVHTSFSTATTFRVSPAPSENGGQG